jgi:cytochrome c553
LRDALDNPETEAAVQRIAENPEAFTKQQLDKFQQGFENQKLKSAIDELLEDEDFRKKIDAPHPSLADVPVKGE